MLNPMLVSPPVTAISGLVPVAAFVIVISFTADAVVVNFNSSFPLASLICAMTGVVKVLFVNVCVPVNVTSPYPVSTTFVPSTKNCFVDLSVAEKVTPVPVTVLN